MPEAAPGWMEAAWPWIAGLSWLAIGILLVAGCLAMGYLFFKWLRPPNSGSGG